MRRESFEKCILVEMHSFAGEVPHVDIQRKVDTIPNFFNGKCVFITGSTGFMGKVLLEKLLWSCKDIKVIYILLRSKKGASLEERLKSLTDLHVFDRIRQNNPEILSKIKPISGNLFEKNLGISDSDLAILEDNVSVIFHVAASVRFDDPIKAAVLLNVRATRDIMELAKRTKNLEMVSYVSTCYSNCDNTIIKEDVYPSYYDWRLMIKLVENMDEHLLNILQRKILVNKPNTYTFTKHLAENVVKDYSEDIPSIIFRPSIVIHSLEDPIPGWVDSFNGPIGLTCGMLAGVVHVLYADQDICADYIPCDLAIRGLIAATWCKASADSTGCKVYNAAVGDRKKIPTDFLVKFIRHDFIYQMPLRKMIWCPTTVITKNKLLFYVMTLLTHLLPGMLIDIILRHKGVEFSLARVYRKIYNANTSLSYFMNRYWKIDTDNYYSILKLLSKDDYNNFTYDVIDINEREALNTGQIGAKRDLFHEDTSETAIEADRIKYMRFYYVHHTLRAVFYVYVCWLFYNIVGRSLLSYFQ